MNGFAASAPSERGTPWPVVVRPMAAGDVLAVAGLLAAREEVEVDLAQRVVRAWAEESRRRVLVAEVEGRVRGYAGCAWRESDSEGEDGPPGWYLSGVVVDPSARRHGLGRQLTEARLSLLAEVAEEVWCVVNARNRASLDLHAALGFVEHGRGPRLAGVEFTGGLGVLLRRVL